MIGPIQSVQVGMGEPVLIMAFVVYFFIVRPYESAKDRYFPAELDAETVDPNTELLREIRDTHGTAILFITHDLGIVATLCDRVHVMYAGAIVEEGPVGTILAGMFPTAVRYTGASLAFNLSGIFGASLAPYVATWLALHHGLASVGYYLTGAAVLTLLALLTVPRQPAE